MSEDIHNSIRCRNYAEELRIIALDRATPENREALLKIAEDYDRIAASYEGIDRAKRLAGLRR